MTDERQIERLEEVLEDVRRHNADLRRQLEEANVAIAILRDQYASAYALAGDQQQEIDILRGQLDAERAKVRRLVEAVRRLQIWPILHEQQHPEWNGNRFDDMQLAKKVLFDCGKGGSGDD